MDFVNDQEFDVAICGGVMSYIENFPTFFAETIRVLRPGGLFVFSQNVVNWDTNIRDCQTVADKLVADGKWACESIGEPEDYTPNNPDAEWSARKIRIHVYRKL